MQPDFELGVHLIYTQPREYIPENLYEPRVRRLIKFRQSTVNSTARKRDGNEWWTCVGATLILMWNSRYCSIHRVRRYETQWTTESRGQVGPCPRRLPGSTGMCTVHDPVREMSDSIRRHYDERDLVFR